MFRRMIFIINIPLYLQYITFYSCKNKLIFPNFQTFSDNCANYERFFVLLHHKRRNPSLIVKNETKIALLCTFCEKCLANLNIICIFAQNFTDNIICKMKYNITSVTDYLEELTGFKTKKLVQNLILQILVYLQAYIIFCYFSYILSSSCISTSRHLATSI